MRNWIKEIVQFIALYNFQFGFFKRKNQKYPFKSYAVDREKDVQNSLLSYDIKITTEDNLTLNALLIQPDQITKDTKYFLVCHGKGTNRYDTTKLANLIKHSKDRSAVFFVIDYRGFEGSQGVFKKHDVNKDLDAAISYLKKTYNTEDIHLVGHSLGCAIIFEYLRYLKQKTLNSQYRVNERLRLLINPFVADFKDIIPAREVKIPENVFCFAPFTNLMDVVEDILGVKARIIKRIFEYLLDDINYNNIENIPHYDGNLVIFCGKNDSLIPLSRSNELKRICEKGRVIFKDKGHNGVFGEEENWDFIFKEVENQVRANQV